MSGAIQQAFMCVVVCTLLGGCDVLVLLSMNTSPLLLTECGDGEADACCCCALLRLSFRSACEDAELVLFASCDAFSLFIHVLISFIQI